MPLSGCLGTHSPAHAHLHCAAVATSVTEILSLIHTGSSFLPPSNTAGHASISTNLRILSTLSRLSYMVLVFCFVLFFSSSFI